MSERAGQLNRPGGILCWPRQPGRWRMLRTAASPPARSACSIKEPGAGVRGVPGGHDKCVPKRRITPMFAQVRAVPATVCKPSAEPTQVRTLDLPPPAKTHPELGRTRLNCDLARPPNRRLDAALGAHMRALCQSLPAPAFDHLLILGDLGGFRDPRRGFALSSACYAGGNRRREAKRLLSADHRQDIQHRHPCDIPCAATPGCQR
jgi:hypothetical protein